MNSANNTPLVSIVIPYYNCAKYILETLDSIKSQTYTNYEIIIVNDGSNPSDTQFIENVLKTESKIKYIYQENQGVSAARNAGGHIAQGEFLLFLDADDVIKPTFLEKTLSAMLQNPNCKLAYTRVEFFEAQTGEWKLPAYTDFKNLLISNKIPATHALHKKVDFDAVGGFDEGLLTHEDWDYWIRLLKNGGDVIRLDEILFKYRKRNDNSSLINQLSANPDKNRRNWQAVCNKHQSLLLENNLGYVDLTTQNSELQNEKENLQQDIVNLNDDIASLKDRIGSLEQNNKNLAYQLSKNKQNQISIPALQSMGGGRDKLSYIYKTPSYKIIRGFRRLNWKLRGRPKKPHFNSLDDQQNFNEAFRILNSFAWNILSPIHILYKLFKRNK
ncbi:hypothetical protein B0181_04730 [Moraxella caviae]|uniref:Chondroitin polymerase n=1 Tax=Moraxella caviae TaxID=34060 RepID=A0A1T0A385_9GAMM|nr:glycosyltransferase family A protein [Moraxella caviae]OOR90184.1 hypothetical protein B0181_04730 [Moraxella caviae]STZ14599.1 Chondroitin polymerase [Moraxella caviae]VEW11368.1 Chondroitin polymerase [Moraxella caviae]